MRHELMGLRIVASSGITYAIGDLHGEATLLRRLLDTVAPGPADTLIFLGDYMDRGEDSLATVEFMRDLEVRYHCIFLRGNHDAAWLEVWDGTSFAEKPLIPGAHRVWEACGGNPPAALGQWLEETQLKYEDGYAFYAHGGALPGVPFWSTPSEVILWGDRTFLTSSHNWGKPVVFGHFELYEPLVQFNKIGLDTAAYRSGVLTALRVQNRAIIQARR